MRDGAVVLEFVAKGIAAHRQVELAVFLHEKHETTLCAGDAQRSLNQRHQDIIESATTVQLARNLEEER